MSANKVGTIHDLSPNPVSIIRLGSGYRMRVGDYVKVWRYVKEAADAGRPVQRCDLTHPFVTRHLL